MAKSLPVAYMGYMQEDGTLSVYQGDMTVS